MTIMLSRGGKKGRIKTPGKIVRMVMNYEKLMKKRKRGERLQIVITFHT